MVRLLPLALVLAAACGTTSRLVYEPATVEQAGAAFRITGPYAHENLAVYLVHSNTPDDREFITLDEGLKDGSVTVTEKGEGEVSQLILENLSNTDLFVQEGDRVRGGKQDRIVGLSFVVPAASGPQPIPSFCVEQGRWSQGSEFGGAASKPLAPKQVREAAKAGKSQQEVWDEVAETKRAAGLSLGTENSNSNLNETMDSEQARRAAEPFEKWLGSILIGKPDAVGVAFALNGAIEEVNIYPGRKLLAKLYPRLLGSYALAAALKREPAAPPTPGEVAAFMKESREKGSRTERVAGNSVVVRDLEANVHCVTEYLGKSVHTQWMRREERPAQAGGNERRQQQRNERPW